jgi:PilZ domain
MAQPQPEKRSTRRFSLELPINVIYANDGKTQFAAQTRDVSSRGVFMYASTEIAEGAVLEFIMILPREITLADPIRVRCHGRVLRVESNHGRQGIAVSIERYDFLS